MIGQTPSKHCQSRQIQPFGRSNWLIGAIKTGDFEACRKSPTLAIGSSVVARREPVSRESPIEFSYRIEHRLHFESFLTITSTSVSTRPSSRAIRARRSAYVFLYCTDVRPHIRLPTQNQSTNSRGKSPETDSRRNNGDDEPRAAHTLNACTLPIVTALLIGALPAEIGEGVGVPLPTHLEGWVLR